MEGFTESIRIKKGSGFSFKAKLRAIYIKQGDYIIMYLPSLGISGYGETKEEAKENLDFSMEGFVDNVQKLSLSKIHSLLINLGWKQKRFKNKEFSHAFIDVAGILRDFNVTKEDIIEDKILEVA